MVEERHAVSDRIKDHARTLGFTHVGIARAQALDAEHARLLEWLRRGYHGSMAYMQSRAEERRDPRLLLDDARSVISVAYNYFTREAHSDHPSQAKISRYAWGDDYHNVLRPKMRGLCDFVKTALPGSECLWYVDTGPVMDKAWAVRAGIGWLGKHTNVITRDMGSWIFLAEVLTTAELEYDVPIEDFCGSCVRCIEACPTQAIVEPYAVDSNRCIPYLTIELKTDSIPESASMDFHGWIFGCDICQDVCPWNSFATETSDTSFAPRPHNRNPELEFVMSLGSGEFSKLYRNSPIKRTKQAGLIRNARAVMEQRKIKNSWQDNGEK